MPLYASSFPRARVNRKQYLTDDGHADALRFFPNVPTVREEGVDVKNYLQTAMDYAVANGRRLVCAKGRYLISSGVNGNNGGTLGNVDMDMGGAIFVADAAWPEVAMFVFGVSDLPHRDPEDRVSIRIQNLEIDGTNIPAAADQTFGINISGAVGATLDQILFRDITLNHIQITAGESADNAEVGTDSMIHIAGVEFIRLNDIGGRGCRDVFIYMSGDSVDGEHGSYLIATNIHGHHVGAVILCKRLFKFSSMANIQGIECGSVVGLSGADMGGGAIVSGTKSQFANIIGHRCNKILALAGCSYVEATNIQGFEMGRTDPPSATAVTGIQIEDAFLVDVNGFQIIGENAGSNILSSQGVAMVGPNIITRLNTVRNGFIKDLDNGVLITASALCKENKFENIEMDGVTTPWTGLASGDDVKGPHRFFEASLGNSSPGSDQTFTDTTAKTIEFDTVHRNAHGIAIDPTTFEISGFPVGQIRFAVRAQVSGLADNTFYILDLLKNGTSAARDGRIIRGTSAQFIIPDVIFNDSPTNTWRVSGTFANAGTKTVDGRLHYTRFAASMG